MSPREGAATPGRDGDRVLACGIGLVPVEAGSCKATQLPLSTPLQVFAETENGVSPPPAGPPIVFVVLTTLSTFFFFIPEFHLLNGLLLLLTGRETQKGNISTVHGRFDCLGGLFA